MGRGDDVTLTIRRSAARTNRRSGGPVPRIAEREITIASGTDDARESASEQAVFVAVVHAVDGVRFTAAAPSRRELVHRVAEYVQRWGGYVLRPDHARHLRGLLARGEWEAAVELYFAVVGKRWDKEWLVTAAVPSGRPRDLPHDRPQRAVYDGPIVASPLRGLRERGRRRRRCSRRARCFRGSARGNVSHRSTMRCPAGVSSVGEESTGPNLRPGRVAGAGSRMARSQATRIAYRPPCGFSPPVRAA